MVVIINSVVGKVINSYWRDNMDKKNEKEKLRSLDKLLSSRKKRNFK